MRPYGAVTYLKENDNDCRLTGFLSDAAGNALANCSYTLCGYDEDDNEFTVSGRTKADGFLDITFIRKSDGDLELMVEHNGETDTLSFESLHQQYRYHTFSSGPLHLKLNTDRAIYRPGDTVRFSGIVSEILPRLQGHVLSGTDIAVFKTNTRSQKECILQTVSDTHGQFTGQWEIPADIRPGWASLCAIVIPHGADPDSIIETAEYLEEYLPGDEIEIKIQSYSRPLLELTFDDLPSPPAPGDTVECSGSIKTPLGIAVSGARIQWSTSIYRTDDYSLAPVGSRTILESGETQTAADGTFVIRFMGVLVGPQSLETLKDLATKYFGAIPKREHANKFDYSPQPYSENLGKMVCLSAVKETRIMKILCTFNLLRLRWILPV